MLPSLRTALLILVLTSCNLGKSSESGKNTEKTSMENSTHVEEDEEPLLKEYKRIIAIGNEITEVIIALGDSNKIVALDKSHPAHPNIKVPKVGYKATLKTRYIFSHNPDAVFSDWEGSSLEIVEEVKGKNIDYHRFKVQVGIEATKDLITKISKKLKKEKRGKRLIARLDKQQDEIRKILKNRKDSLRVVYIHARGPETLLISGAGTPAAALINLAGAKNAAQDFEGMERLTGEDMFAINPDFILMSKKGVASLEGKIYEVPAIFESRAYRMGRLIILEDYEVLNFGINSAKTALELSKKLYQQQYYAPLPTPEYSNPNKTDNKEPKKEIKVEIIKENEKK